MSHIHMPPRGLGHRLQRSILLIVTTLGIAGANHMAATATAQQPPATPVRVDAARVESVSRMVPVTGDIQARRRSIVASEEEGILRTVSFDAGQEVSEGESLAEIDSDLLRIQLTGAQAALEESRAAVQERQVELEQAESDLNSLLELEQTGSAGPKEVADARSAFALAQARLNRAHFAVTLTETEIRRIERKLRADVIRAPFEGIVVVKHVEIGQWLDVGGPVAEIVESGMVDAVINVPEQIINRLQVEMPIQVDIRALDEPQVGRVRAIVPVADEQARTYPVKIELDDLGGRIKPGMSLTAWAPTGELSNATTISKDAIMRSATGPYVYVVRNGVAAMTPIVTQTSASGNRIVIAPGAIQSGDLLVVEGNERLFPGAPVAPTNADEFVSNEERAPGTSGADG